MAVRDAQDFDFFLPQMWCQFAINYEIMIEN